MPLSREERKRRRRQKVSVEITIELLRSKRNFFKTEEQILRALDRKIKHKTKEMKDGFTPEEAELLKQIALAIQQRDENLFIEITHRLRNRLAVLGGFSQRLIKLANQITAGLKDPKSKFQELNHASDEIKRDARIIVKEVKRTERRMNFKKSPNIQNHNA